MVKSLHIGWWRNDCLWIWKDADSLERETMERIENLNIAVEEWKVKYKNMEKEKELLFNEKRQLCLQEKQSVEKKVCSLESDKENMSYINQLENNNNPPQNDNKGEEFRP